MVATTRQAIPYVTSVSSPTNCPSPKHQLTAGSTEWKRVAASRASGASMPISLSAWKVGSCTDMATRPLVAYDQQQ